MTSHSSARSGSFYGWRILVTFWFVLTVNLGFIVYGAGVINTYMAEAMGMSSQMLGLPFSVFLLMLGLPAPAIALGINRFGLRPVFFIGTVLICAGSIAMATWVTGPLSAALAFGGLVGTGVAMGGNISTQVGIGRWFVRRRATALALMLSANGIGGMIAAPVLDRVIDATGDWRSGWLIIAGLSLVVGVAATIVVRDYPSDVGQRPDGDTEEQQSSAPRQATIHITAREFEAKEAMRSRAFWIILSVIVVNFLGLSLVLSHGVANLRSLGHSAAASALAVSVVSGGTLLGKLCLGVLGDRIEPRFLWIVATLSIACGLLTAPYAASTFGMIAYAGLFGFGFGGALVLQSAMLMNYFGTRAFATLLGCGLLAQTIFSAIAPIVAGLLHDTVGNYTLVFLGVGVLSVAAALSLFLARPPRQLETVHL